MDFSTLNKEQLREELLARQLPVSGTNPELIDRLNAYEYTKAQVEGAPDMGEDDDLLGDLGDPPPAPTPTAPPEAPVTQPDPNSAVQPDPSPAEPQKDPRLLPGNRFEAVFACPSELSTGVHQDNQLRARAAAEEAGYAVRGGAYSAIRVGFRDIKGIRHAVYELSIRKE